MTEPSTTWDWWWPPARVCVDCGDPFHDGDESTLVCQSCGHWAEDGEG